MEFLKQVARHYYDVGNMERLCFVFPNRRSLVFFNKYVAERVGEDGVPLISPELCTMNDFFYRICGSAQSDRVTLILRLYECYRELNPGAESLDEFIFWGDIILSDFNDVDKYLADPDMIFSNIADFRKMQDDFSYLTEDQKKALEQFLGHFKTSDEYKEKFRSIWDILLPLYRKFNSLLGKSSLSYEGMVYRELAARLETTPAVDLLETVFPRTDKFVFVGLNALNNCERKLLSKLRDAGRAEFCWDYSSDMIKHPANKSSFFMQRNVQDYPQAFKMDEDGLEQPEINVLSIPSGVGQAKQLPKILESCSGDINTAIVLPDEGLLLPVLNSIPETVRDINVTMGYPMNGSTIWSLMNDISALQMHLRLKDEKWYFYHRQVWAILSNSLVKSAVGEEGRQIITRIHESPAYYVEESAFVGDPVLESIFKPVAKNTAEASARQIAELAEYISTILTTLAPRLGESAGMSLELDFARDYLLAVKRISSERLEVLPATYFKLLSRLVGTSSVPFKGEPLRGLQIMGPLETRALDFENLIVLSCNEGMFPRRTVSSSFIPAELRKGFDLPTYEYQDAVWAYYFYRMIQRSRKVWLLYDSRTEGVKGGEESRYIKQLEMHFKLPVKRFVASSGIRKSEPEKEIPKTAEDIAKIKSSRLSASSLQSYLSCPAKFYYKVVAGLKASDEVSESLDSGMFGTVFHETMQDLYTVPDKKITVSYLESLLADTVRIKELVDAHIKEELKCFDIEGRNLIYESLIMQLVNTVIARDKELLEAEGRDCFRILGLEKFCRKTIDGFEFVGYIDRLDSLNPGEVRVVDYKTGKVTDEDFLIDESNSEAVVEALFGPDDSKRPKIALQLYLYDLFASEDENLKIVNSIYQPYRLKLKEVENIELCDEFCTLMKQRLSDTMAEVSNPEVPFRRTEDSKVCDYCDFKQICGR